MSIGGEIVASRTFDHGAQEDFAAFSGDRNPIHMDVLVSRRAPPGKPVVHGLHMLLWSLDALAKQGLLGRHDFQLNVTFQRWAYIGDLVTVTLPGTGNGDRFQLRVGDLTVATVGLRSAEAPRVARQPVVQTVPEPLTDPLHLTLDQVNNSAGHAYCGDVAPARRLFPALSQAIGTGAVAELASTSYIVGMLVPGFYSMFSKLNLTVLMSDFVQPALAYRIARVDDRFRKVTVAVTGNSIEGTMQAFMRPPPVRQPSVQELPGIVDPQEFAHIQALITGGSRGLGELTANLIAAGGGSVTVTYATGQADAERVVADLCTAGHTAFQARYDVREPVETLLSGLRGTPTHLFHFATPTISTLQSDLFSSRLLNDFLTFYVTSFYALCKALAEQRNSEGHASPLYVLYPSTVFVEETPPGMLEYGMAKAAGERLCAELNLRMHNLEILVARLPKLLTDQTAGIVPDSTADAVATLLPCLRQMATRRKTT